MTIDEAIKMFEENADVYQHVADTQELGDGHYVSELYCDDTDAINDHLERCRIQAKEHKQLSEWLKKLKAVKQIIVQHDSDRMPEDYWYIDKIREVVREVEE